MKHKKIIGIITAANLAVGIAAFAQQDAAQPSATEPDVNQPAGALPGQDAQTQPSTETDPADEAAGADNKPFEKETFLKEASKSGVAEVNMAQIGTQKAQDPALKEAARKIVNDHSELNDKLKELAQNKGITLSTEVDPKHQKMIDHLSGLSGSEFDKAFASHMVQGHKKSIAKYKKAANSDDSEISQLAQNTLPKLQEHLRSVQKWAPDVTAGTEVEEPAGAEPKADDQQKDDSNAAPDYKSPTDANKSDI